MEKKKNDPKFLFWYAWIFGSYNFTVIPDVTKSQRMHQRLPPAQLQRCHRDFAPASWRADFQLLAPTTADPAEDAHVYTLPLGYSISINADIFYLICHNILSIPCHDYTYIITNYITYIYTWYMHTQSFTSLDIPIGVRPISQEISCCTTMSDDAFLW